MTYQLEHCVIHNNLLQSVVLTLVPLIITAKVKLLATVCLKNLT